MKKLFLLFLLAPAIGFSQVGIGTEDPKGALDIQSNTLGLVLPRVTAIENVTNNNSGLAENGTIVYDVSRDKTCFRVSSVWICIANDASIAITTPSPAPPPPPPNTNVNSSGRNSDGKDPNLSESINQNRRP